MVHDHWDEVLVSVLLEPLVPGKPDSSGTHPVEELAYAVCLLDDLALFIQLGGLGHFDAAHVAARLCRGPTKWIFPVSTVSIRAGWMPPVWELTSQTHSVWEALTLSRLRRRWPE